MNERHVWGRLSLNHGKVHRQTSINSRGDDSKLTTKLNDHMKGTADSNLLVLKGLGIEKTDGSKETRT